MTDAPERPLTIVTVGSRGIGAAICLELAREGHDIVLNYVSREDAAVELARRVEALGARCLPVRADVTDERAGGPEDIAPTVAHVLSDRASYLSGAVITVSGGL